METVDGNRSAAACSESGGVDLISLAVRNHLDILCSQSTASLELYRAIRPDQPRPTSNLSQTPYLDSPVRCSTKKSCCLTNPILFLYSLSSNVLPASAPAPESGLQSSPTTFPDSIGNEEVGEALMAWRRLVLPDPLPPRLWTMIDKGGELKARMV